MVAIHLPHRDLAAIAVQENVGFAASAEVSFGPLIAICCQAYIFELSNGKG
jgi:hypothetical protein